MTTIVRTAEIIIFLILLATIAQLWMAQNSYIATLGPARNATRRHPGNSACPLPRADHNVSFIRSDQMERGRSDIYSGMWWQSIDAMLRVDYSRAVNREGITFLSYKNAEVLSTADWLDLSVEHLSKYVKHFDGLGVRDDRAMIAMRQRVAEIIEQYIVRSKETCHGGPGSPAARSAASTTIAILPHHVSSGEGTYGFNITTLQLAATVASLWNVGFERAVVVGVHDNARSSAGRAAELLGGHLGRRRMELAYVGIPEADVVKNKKEMVNVPMEAMIGFQRAYREYQGSKGRRNGTDGAASSWLGEDPSRWRHIYFTEPDLVLHVRPGALPYLSDALERGSILGAHRLNALPHLRQFDKIHANATSGAAAAAMEGGLLPDAAAFAGVHRLDVASGDACCDQGKFYPPNGDEPFKESHKVRRKGVCRTNWAYCGYSRTGDHSDWSSVLERHGMLLTVPIVSLDGGTGLPLVHSGQRACTPRRGAGDPCR